MNYTNRSQVDVQLLNHLKKQIKPGSSTHMEHAEFL